MASVWVTSNPAFQQYVISSAVLGLKVLSMALFTARHRIGRNIFANPEDAAMAKTKVIMNDPDVERVRRATESQLNIIMMDLPAGGVGKKLKAEEVAASSCEKFALNSRSAAAGRDALIKCQPNTADCANCMHTASAPVNEVYIKEEPIYDAQASTSQKQHLMIKAEKSFNIKHEPLSSEDENCNLNLVEDSSDADHPSAILSASGLKKTNSTECCGKRIVLQCSECDYETVYKGNFIFHLQKHSNHKPYVCSDCNYKTDCPANLKIHMQTHTGEKPFECSECNYKAAQISHLKTHMQTHTGDKLHILVINNYDGERIILAAQDQGLYTNGLKKVLGLVDDDRCRFCGQAVESTNHLLSGCGTLLAEGRYTVRHNRVCRVIHWKLCKEFGFPVVNESWKHEPPPIIENTNAKITYDHHIPVARPILNSALRPDIVLFNKNRNTGLIIDVSVPGDFGISRQEREKIVKYQDLKNDMKETYHLKEVEIVPVIFGATGVVKKNQAQYLELIPGNINRLELQVEVVKESVSILKRALGCRLLA